VQLKDESGDTNEFYRPPTAAAIAVRDNTGDWSA